MAGIGFELKKIFKEDSIVSIAVGIGYSSIITIGPTVIVMATLIFLYYAMGILSVSYAQRDLLSTTILYIFIFANILTSFLNAVFSRYIADKFYEEKYDDILPSYYTGITLLSVFATLICLPICYRLVTVGGVDLGFVFVSYALWMIVIILFYSITFLHATKDYKIVALNFIIGMIVGILSAFVFRYLLGIDVIESILYGLTLGFFLITVLVVAYIRKYFRSFSSNYTECMSYIFKYKTICFANFFYFLGLYIHNFVFWTTDKKLVVADTLVCMQPYDMATCIALFTNISTVMIFIVLVETKFHDVYQKYMESVIGATYSEIEKYKKSMFRVLFQQIGHVFAIQVIITAILFLTFSIFLPRFGFGGLTMEIYPSLAVGYLGIFIMYGNMIFLFYFNDNKGAMWTGIILCITTIIATWIAKDLTANLYGIGTFIGAIAGWTFSYFRIRYIQRNFENHIFGNQKIINICKDNVRKTIIYENKTAK